MKARVRQFATLRKTLDGNLLVNVRRLTVNIYTGNGLTEVFCHC